MTSPTTNDPPTKPRRSRWGQFRLATIFLLMVVAAIAFAWWRALESRYQRGRELEATLTLLGGDVFVAYDGPVWLKGMPTDYLFQRIQSVRIEEFSPEIIERVIAKHPEQRASLEPLLASGDSPGDWLLEALVEHPHLTALLWHRVRLTDRGVRLLAEFDRIEDLTLSQAGLEDQHLEIIGQRLTLQDLNLNGNRLTDAGIPSLMGLSRLVTLELCSHPKISNAGLRQLAKLPMLGELVVMGSSVTADEVAAVHRARPELSIEWESTPDEPYETPVVSDVIKID